MHGEVRKGVTQAKFNDSAIGVIGAELIIVSIVLGVLTHSWIVFGISLVGLIICFQIRKIAIILSVILSIGWGFTAWAIGDFFGISTTGLIVISIIAALCGGGYHMASMEYIEDLQ